MSLIRLSSVGLYSSLRELWPHWRKSKALRNVDMNMPHFRLFILGAGFSQPAGLPLSHELLDCVRHQIKVYHRHNWRDWGELEGEIDEWKRLYPFQPIDLERVLAYSHRKHYLGLSKPDEFFAHGSRTIVAARRAIQRILIGRTPPDTPPLYRRFVNCLTPNDHVLTFNYDTLLEESFDAVGKPYSLSPEWWLSQELSDTGYEYVDLLKLHGSVDWYDRKYHDDSVRWHLENGQEVPDEDPIFGPKPAVQTEPLSKGGTTVYGRSILSRVFRVPDHAQLFPFDESPFTYVVPFLLPLSYDKLLGYDPVLDFWEALHKTTKDYSSIVIIGYSMPSHDSYAYEALGQLCVDYQEGDDENVWGHRRVPIQIITMADSKSCAMNGMPFLDSADTRVWLNGFSEDALNWLDWGDDCLTN